jgi:hypothetical protein
MLCASGVAMENYGLLQRYDFPVVQIGSLWNAGFAHHIFSWHTTDIIPEFNLSLHY